MTKDVAKETQETKALALIAERFTKVKKDRSEKFLGAFDFDKIMDSVPTITASSLDKFKELMTDAKEAEDIELLIDYATRKMPGKEEFAAEMIRHFLDSNPPPGPGPKLDRCLMLAAKMGNAELYVLVKAKNGRLTRKITGSNNNVVVTNATGKSALHYACQSENAALVKQIADDIKSETSIGNPFTISDQQSINSLRPIHYISAGLAEELDRAYSLDGNKSGSFSSAVGYYRRIGKTLSQGFVGFVKTKLSAEKRLAERAAILGKYSAGFTIASYETEFLKMSMTMQHVVMDTVGPTCIAAVASVALAANHLVQKKNAKRDNLSPTLVLDSGKQQKGGSVTNKSKLFQKDYYPTPINTKEANYNVMRAIKLHDFSEIEKYATNYYFNPDLTIVDALSKVAYFNDQEQKEIVYKAILAKAKDSQIEKVLESLANRSKTDLELAKKMLSDFIKEGGRDVDTLKHCALMAAQFGDIGALDRAVDALKKKGVKNLLDIKHENDSPKSLSGKFHAFVIGDKRSGSNLMHYACNGGHIEMIQHLEQRMEQEFRVLPESERGDARSVFELTNARGDRAKHYISRDAAKLLNVEHLMDSESGFSDYAARGFKDKTRQDRAATIAAMATSGSMASAFFAKAVPISLVVAAAVSHGAAPIAHTALAALFEGSTTVFGAMAAHGVLLPMFDKFYRTSIARSKGYDVEIAGLKESDRIIASFTHELRAKEKELCAENVSEDEQKKIIIDAMKKSSERLFDPKMSDAEKATACTAIEATMKSILSTPGVTPFSLVQSVFKVESRMKEADWRREAELVDQTKDKLIAKLRNPPRFRSETKLKQAASELKKTLEGLVVYHKSLLSKAESDAFEGGNTQFLKASNKVKIDYLFSLKETIRKLDEYVKNPKVEESKLIEDLAMPATPKLIGEQVRREADEVRSVADSRRISEATSFQALFRQENTAQITQGATFLHPDGTPTSGTGARSVVGR